MYVSTLSFTIMAASVAGRLGLSMLPTAAIFDFGGVLTTPVWTSFDAFGAAVGLPSGALMRAFIAADAEDAVPDFHRFEIGVMTEAEFFARMRVRAEAEAGPLPAWPEDPAAAREVMIGTLRPNEEMLDAAARIRAHHPVGICTNNAREWSAWRDLVRAHEFDVVVDSCEEGVRKPDPEIYLRTCARLGVAPEQTMFVDDLPHNVEGARAVGLRAVRFTTTEETLAALREAFPRIFQESPHA